MGFGVGEYVSWTDKSDKKVKVGRVTGPATSDKLRLKVQEVDNEFKDVSGGETDRLISELSRAGIGKFMSRTGTDQATEIAVNTAFYSAIQALFRKHKAFGHETLSFLTADALYELLVKYYVTDMVAMMVPKAAKDGGGWLEVGDAHDAAAKTIPIVVIQQIVCKFAYKHRFGSGLLKQAVDSFAAITLGNVAGRNITRRSEDNKGKDYRW
jgi:hypothetical protein